MNFFKPKKNYIPYGKQHITKEDINSVVKVLKSDLITQGHTVPEFENSICDTVKAKYSIAVNSATSALHLACLSLGLGSGDWLWTSSNTFVASANCGIYCGANVDFVDIDLETGHLSIENLKQKLSIAKYESKLPKIIIPVHFSGSSCDMKAIKDLSKIYGFSIIEDASHALGGSFDNHYVGSCRYSDLTVFSFHPVKIITSGEGGIVTTNNSRLAEIIRELRSHGITKNKDKFVKSNFGPWSYEQQNLGFNYRMTDIHAALGLSQLKRLKSIISERTNIFAIYKKELEDFPLKILKVPSSVISSFHLAVIVIDEKSSFRHKKIFSYMRSKGIGVQLHYEPVPLQPYYLKFGFKKEDYKNSLIYSNSAMSLPIYPGLSKKDQKSVIEILRLALKQY